MYNESFQGRLFYVYFISKSDRRTAEKLQRMCCGALRVIKKRWINALPADNGRVRAHAQDAIIVMDIVFRTTLFFFIIIVIYTDG